MSSPSAYLLAFLIPLAACTKATSVETDTDDTDASQPSGVCTSFDPVFTAGEVVNGVAGAFVFTYQSNSPTPPEKGDNTMTIGISDLTGSPVQDAIVIVEPFMVDHGHGTSPAEFSAENNGDGTYTTPAIDLFMSGVWDIEITATVTSETLDTGGQEPETTVDSVVFSFCLEG